MDTQDRRSIYSRMEDVDKSVVHVIAVIGAVVAVLAYFAFPAGIFDVPRAQLTAGILLRLSAAVVLAVIAILIFIDVVKVFIKR